MKIVLMLKFLLVNIQIASKNKPKPRNLVPEHLDGLTRPRLNLGMNVQFVWVGLGIFGFQPSGLNEN